MTSRYINPDTQLTDYMIFPRFLFDIPINETATLVYMILLDRARLSCRDPVWCDPENRVFILFPVKQIAKRLGKGMSVVKEALTVLESHGLIRRKPQGIGRASRIYVLLPKKDSASTQPEYRSSGIPAAGKAATMQPKNRPPGSRKTGHVVAGIPAGNKNNNSKNNRIKMRSENTRHPYGRYKNVLLSPEELKALSKEIPHPEDYIEKLSGYMRSKGCAGKYKDHAATILLWAQRDKEEGQKKRTQKSKDYSYKEGESL